jgi:hypothetical protein
MRKCFIAVILLLFLANTVVRAPAHTIEDHGRKENDERVRIVEHKISALELEELKRKYGVWEKGKVYNLTIDGHGTGSRPPTDTEWAEIADKAYVVDEILFDPEADPPPSIDHTVSLWFPPIGDQGSENSCVGWAVGYYVKTFQEAKEHGWDLSGAEWIGDYGYPTPAYQDRIFSPDFIYHLINEGMNQGVSPYDALDVVCSIGVSSWEKMPYDPLDSSSWPSEEAWREAPMYRGNSSGYRNLPLDTDANITSLKNWIASDHLALIGVDATQFSSFTEVDLWTVDNYEKPPASNHRNTIVGYDDSFEYMEEAELRHGAFKIVNSWGVGGWENVPDGCYWISYEAMKRCVGICIYFWDLIDYDPSLIASFEIDHSNCDECNIRIGMGNSSAPVATKSFSDLINGGSLPFGSDKIVLDISEFEDIEPTVINQSFYMRVFDLSEHYAHSGTHYWYSFYQLNSWFSFYQNFTIPETGATLNFWSYYEIEKDYDYGYVEVYDRDTDEVYTLPGLTTVSTLPYRYDNPNCEPNEFEPTAYYDAGRWNAFTGFSELYEEEMDLTPFSGHLITLYFTYWTDNMYQWLGWCVDDIAIPEIGFFDDVEDGLDGWTRWPSYGWRIKTTPLETPTTGTILSFSIEHYQSYSSGYLEAVSASRDVPVSTEDLVYVYAFTIAGDVDGDNSVDHDDLVIMVAAYGLRSEDPAYEPDADFNKDNNVDCHDLRILGRNYGKTAI